MTMDPFRMEVRNPEIEDLLRKIGSILTQACEMHSPEDGPKYGFALLIFNFGDDKKISEMFYASNAEREGIVRMMQEFIEKFREH